MAGACFVYQTSVNPVRQKTQAIVKKAFEHIGIEVELKAVTPVSIFPVTRQTPIRSPTSTPISRCFRLVPAPRSPGASESFRQLADRPKSQQLVGAECRALVERRV